jgi:hypothetical protein
MGNKQTKCQIKDSPQQIPFSSPSSEINNRTLETVSWDQLVEDKLWPLYDSNGRVCHFNLGTQSATQEVSALVPDL